MFAKLWLELAILNFPNFLKHNQSYTVVILDMKGPIYKKHQKTGQGTLA